MSLIFLCCFIGCGKNDPRPVARPDVPQSEPSPQPKQVVPPKQARDFKVVHVFVALCDNKNQGIVPVPEKLGNGQDPANNLYWGAQYGVKTFFRRSSHWEAVISSSPRLQHPILDRIVFRSKGSEAPVYVVADAYDGAAMPATLQEFLNAAAGVSVREVSIQVDGKAVTIQAGAYADLVCFVGHNGLMDHALDESPENQERTHPPSAMVLACKSQSYFAPWLRKVRCQPLLMTTGLMAPEAYTLDAAIRGWMSGTDAKDIPNLAAQAYGQYQKIPVSSARRLFVSGFGD